MKKKLIEDSKVLTVLHSIAVALNDLHSNNIVHGYVEPRHFLYNPKTFGVKIHDLGFSEPNPPQHYPPDIDPDVIESRIFKNNKLYSAVDTWALGVFLFKYLRQDKSDFGTTDPPDYSKYRGDDMSILTRCFEDESKMKDLSFFIKACIDAKTEKNTDKQKGKPKEKAPKDKDTEEETEEVENLLSEEKPKKPKGGNKTNYGVIDNAKKDKQNDSTSEEKPKPKGNPKDNYGVIDNVKKKQRP